MRPPQREDPGGTVALPRAGGPHSRYPCILASYFNTGPHSPEMEAFRREKVVQLASQGVGPTFPLNEQIDYIFADPRLAGPRLALS